MSIAKRAAEILRTLQTIDRRDVSRAFAFEPRQAYDLATAAIDRTGSAQRAADLIDSGWSHTDLTMHVPIGRVVTVAEAGARLLSDCEPLDCDVVEVDGAPVTLADLMQRSLIMPVVAQSLDELNALCGYASVDRLAGKVAAPTSQPSEARRDAGLVPPGVDDLDQLADAEVDVSTGADGESVPGVDQRGG